MVQGPTHTNLIFDAVVPQETASSEEEARTMIQEKVSSLGKQYRTVVKIDRFYVK